MPVLLGAAAVLLAAGCGENGTGPAQIKKGMEEEVRDEGGERIVFAGSLEGENEEKAREMAAQSIVRLEVEDSGTGTVYFGSGILWDGNEEQLVIVTSGHLLKEGALPRVIFPGGKELSGETAGICAQKDMGFVTVPVSLLEKEDQNAAVVSLHQRIFDTLDQNSRLLVLGCSENGIGDQFRTGTLKEKSWYREEFGADIMVLECESRPGMSGGGVFDCYGNLVGMVGGGSGSNTAAFSMETVNEGYEEIFGVKRNTEEYRPGAG